MSGRTGDAGPSVPRLYLDWNASAPIAPSARQAAVAALEAGGNPSSVHGEGRAGRAVVERARRALAARFDVPAERVTFTSGGTEANATALQPGTGDPPAQRLIVSAAEHLAVLSGGAFPPADVTVAPVDGAGRVDLAGLEKALAADARPALVSVMAANNETGALSDLPAVRALAKAHGACLHTDAVQAFGRVPDGSLCADVLTLSGHKVGAPPGVGALVRLAEVPVAPLIRGGGQERGARGGTENVPSIAGLLAALAEPAADPSAWEATRTARDRFEAELRAAFPDATIFASAGPRLPNTSLFALPVPAEIALIGLDLAGVAVSSGAACSSGKVAPSHVLSAMGVPGEIAARAIRVSLGPSGAAENLSRFMVALNEVIVPMKR